MSPGRSPPVFRSPSRTAGGTPGTPPTSGEVFSEYHGQWQQQNHAETPEPDETTGIVMKSSHPRGVPPGLNYQSMSGNENNGPRARARKTGTVKNTANGNENGHMNGNENGYEQNKEADAWWKTQLAKFGSIELENKGSVARDHLALGKPTLQRHFAVCAAPAHHHLPTRTDIPCLATDISLLRLHRDCYYTALPIKHLPHGRRKHGEQYQRAYVTAARETTRCCIPRYQYINIVSGLQ